MSQWTSINHRGLPGAARVASCMDLLSKQDFPRIITDYPLIVIRPYTVSKGLSRDRYWACGGGSTRQLGHRSLQLLLYRMIHGSVTTLLSTVVVIVMQSLLYGVLALSGPWQKVWVNVIVKCSVLSYIERLSLSSITALLLLCVPTCLNMCLVPSSGSKFPTFNMYTLLNFYLLIWLDYIIQGGREVAEHLCAQVKLSITPVGLVWGRPVPVVTIIDVLL